MIGERRTMTFGSRWERLKEHWRYKYMPRVADWLLDLSTLQARRALAHAGGVSMLIDNTILFHGVTHETAWVSTGRLSWGGTDQTAGYATRLPVHPYDDESEDYRNVKYLAGIAHLARRGCISLKTSAELQAERIRQPSGRFNGYGYFDFSVFRGIDMRSVDGPPLISMGPASFGLPKLVDQQRRRINQSGDALHEALIARLGQRNSQDAWHIRTAERYGAYCFLTMDRKLLRALEGIRKHEPVKSLRTLVLTPEQFGKRWGLIPVPPFVLSYNDASSFVRTDLCMANGKRRPMRGYRVD